MTTARTIRVTFQGASRNVNLSSPATLSGLQEAVASTFGIELPVRSSGIIADGDLSFTYRDPDGDNIVFDKDFELNLALRTCPELEVRATTLDGDEDTLDAEQRGGVKPEQQQLDPEAVGDIYDVAARNLRENNGVPSITAASLQHTLALLQLRPGRLVVQGLAAPWRLRNADMPLLQPTMRSAPGDEEGVVAATNTETPCEIAPVASSNEDGRSLEAKPKPGGEQDDTEGAAEGAAPFIATDTLAAADNAAVITPAAINDDADVRDDVTGGPTVAAVGAAAAATAAAEDTIIGDSIDAVEMKEMTVAHEDPIHAALVASGVHLPLGEVRPLLSALRVHPNRFVKLGLVDCKALYGARSSGIHGGLYGVGDWVFGWGKHAVGIVRPHNSRHAGALPRLARTRNHGVKA